MKKFVVFVSAFFIFSCGKSENGNVEQKPNSVEFSKLSNTDKANHIFKNNYKGVELRRIKFEGENLDFEKGTVNFIGFPYFEDKEQFFNVENGALVISRERKDGYIKTSDDNSSLYFLKGKFNNGKVEITELKKIGL